MSRIEPLSPPFESDVGEQLATMMPPGVPPIVLFRTFAKNLPMAKAMGGWGSYELGRSLSLTMREREIIIDRTCARCACEYEWGVHVAFFADRVGLDHGQLVSITHGSAADPCWSDERDRVLMDMVDALHESSGLPDDLYDRLAAEFGEAEILDALLLCGWYHAISFVANGATIALEDDAPRFSEYAASGACQ